MYVGQHLSFTRVGKATRGSQGQNRTGEIPPSGIAGGPEETWTMVELGTHLAIERASAGNSLPKVVRRSSTPISNPTANI